MCSSRVVPSALHELGVGVNAHLGNVKTNKFVFFARANTALAHLLRDGVLQFEECVSDTTNHNDDDCDSGGGGDEEDDDGFCDEDGGG